MSSKKVVKLNVVEVSHEHGEWSLGHLDDAPAIGDQDGCWYKVNGEVVIPQPSKKLVWFLHGREWACIHQIHWNAELTPPTNLSQYTAKDPDYIAR